MKMTQMMFPMITNSFAGGPVTISSYVTSAAHATARIAIGMSSRSSKTIARRSRWVSCSSDAASVEPGCSTR
jgi:hypothetical protein